MDKAMPEPYDPNAPRSFDNSSNNNYREPIGGTGTLNDDASRKLEAALHSPYGIDKLLNRLKQSIYSAREFSSFLRERCALEDRHAQGYKKLVRNTIESVRRAEARQGTYASNFDEALKVNERIADNGLAFASALHTMAEELRDVADNAEKGRKHWKHSTIDAEKRLADAESAQQKAKDRYNNAAEQYQKVRTGERQGGKFALKGKSPAQQEETLKEKADTLDSEFAAKFEAHQAQKREFEGSTRPQIVRALKELIDECDAAMAMQMAKLASVSEKNVVSNGMAIAPINTTGTGPEPRGLRQIARDIDDRKDFSEYMLDGVEPLQQFKGRSRRNTEGELIQTPMQRADTMETPYSTSQQNAESRPPQLPQIGGSDSFSRSFEAERPTQQNRNSYFGGQSDGLGSNSIYSTQQAGVVKDPAPSLPTGRGAPPIPSLPSYDRGQATTAEGLDNGNNGFNRSQGQLRQDPTSLSTGPGRLSTDNPPYDRDREQGSGRYDPASSLGSRGQTYGNDSFTNRTEGPARQDTLPVFGGRGQSTATDTLADHTGGPGRPSTVLPFAGRGQSTATEPFGDRTQGSARQETKPVFGGREGPTLSDVLGPRAGGTGRPDTIPPFAGRGQSTPIASMVERNHHGVTGQDSASPIGGRGQPLAGLPSTAFTDRSQNTDRAYQQQSSTIGGFPGSGKSHSPVDSSGFGRRSQETQGVSPVGKGGALGGRSLLPSQQQQQQQQPQRPMLPPNRPVFGMHLDDLFRRDGSAVPAIVFQCIQAVDRFGLSTQGIYRVSGSTPVVQQLKSEFDHDSNNVDLADREVFNNDIAAVATLLKNFLRDLPDPLLTATAYHSFLQAARYEDNIQRRDALHQYINSLPDPNYATLRVLTLHLHRISLSSDVNMMDIKNLAIVFGPTVMGGGSMSDTGLQTKVMETILHHTHDIFDPDE